MATFVNQTSTTGTLSYTQAASPGCVWNLSSLIIGFAGPSRGPNARVTVYDGSLTGTILYRNFLDQPNGSIGMYQDLPLPKDQSGKVGLQSSPGNAMIIVVDGFGANQCSLNARITDGLP